MPPSPQLKFRNKPTTLGGLRFSSQAEARRYGELVLLERAGLITNIVLQPKFPISINGMTICTYIADFSYEEDNRLIVEDVKSVATKTPVYQIKKRLVKAVHGLDIREVEYGAGQRGGKKDKRISRS